MKLNAFEFYLFNELKTKSDYSKELVNNFINHVVNGEMSSDFAFLVFRHKLYNNAKIKRKVYEQNIDIISVLVNKIKLKYGESYIDVIHYLPNSDVIFEEVVKYSNSYRFNTFWNIFQLWPDNNQEKYLFERLGLNYYISNDNKFNSNDGLIVEKKLFREMCDMLFLRAKEEEWLIIKKFSKFREMYSSVNRKNFILGLAIICNYFFSFFDNIENRIKYAFEINILLGDTRFWKYNNHFSLWNKIRHMEDNLKFLSSINNSELEEIFMFDIYNRLEWSRTQLKIKLSDITNVQNIKIQTLFLKICILFEEFESKQVHKSISTDYWTENQKFTDLVNVSTFNKKKKQLDPNNKWKITETDIREIKDIRNKIKSCEEINISIIDVFRLINVLKVVYGVEVIISDYSVINNVEIVEIK